MQPTAISPSPASPGDPVNIRPGMALPSPDEAAAATALERLSTIDLGVCSPTLTALGALTNAVAFVAAVQASAYPRPLLSTRVVLLTGAHTGGVAAGPAPDPRNALPLQHLAGTAGAGVVTLEWQPASAAIEVADAITAEQMDAAMQAGWAEAERAADEGIELLVLAAGGAGAATAAAAVVAAITGAEPPALLARVVTPAGRYDDNAWMARCLALRDALHRVRDRDGDPRTVLSALGGADIAAATGLLLGAASRRTPVMIDGPVGAAAALLAKDFSAQSRRWVLLPDHGRHPAVRLAAETLELRPWLDLHLDLGEGVAALAALPMLQTALTLAGVGEPAEALPLTRYDSAGNRVFVGVAKPIEPAIPPDGPRAKGTSGTEAMDSVAPTTVETTPVAPTQAGLKKVDTLPTVTVASRAAVGVGRSSAKGSPAKAAPPRAAVTKEAPAKVASVKETAGTAKDSTARDAPDTSRDRRGGPPTSPDTLDEVATGKEAPGKEAPGKAAPGKAAPGTAAPGTAAPAKDVAAKAIAGKAIAGKDTPTKDTPTKDTPTKDTTTKDTPTKETPGKKTPGAAEVSTAGTQAAGNATVTSTRAAIISPTVVPNTQLEEEAPTSGSNETQAKQAQTKQAQSKDAQSKGAQSKEAQSKDAQSKDAQSKGAQSKEAQSKEAQSKDAQSKEAQSKDAQSKEAQSKDAQTRQTSSNDAASREAAGSRGTDGATVRPAPGEAVAANGGKSEPADASAAAVAPAQTTAPRKRP